MCFGLVSLCTLPVVDINEVKPEPFDDDTEEFLPSLAQYNMRSLEF